MTSYPDIYYLVFSPIIGIAVLVWMLSAEGEVTLLDALAGFVAAYILAPFIFFGFLFYGLSKVKLK